MKIYSLGYSPEEQKVQVEIRQESVLRMNPQFDKRSIYDYDYYQSNYVIRIIGTTIMLFPRYDIRNARIVIKQPMTNATQEKTL